MTPRLINGILCKCFNLVLKKVVYLVVRVEVPKGPILKTTFSSVGVFMTVCIAHTLYIIWNG